MTRQSPRCPLKNIDRPLAGDAPHFDDFLFDDPFDDFLDRHVTSLRESLADFRNIC